MFDGWLGLQIGIFSEGSPGKYRFRGLDRALKNEYLFDEKIEAPGKFVLFED